MMAMLWAQEIMNGRKTYEQVPRLLKAEVRRILIESGLDDPEQPEEEIETEDEAEEVMAKLWSIIYDLILYLKASGLPVPEKIQDKIDSAEEASRPYGEE